MASSPYNSTDEVVWFVSVTQETTWEKSRFENEYHVVHAGMTKKVAEMTPALRGYTQLKNLKFQHLEADQPEWNCVTRLTWESLAAIWGGFQNPNYKATAGKHIFCRLDQVGTLAKEVGGFRGGSATGTEARVLVFHRRASATDEASNLWAQERVKSVESSFGGDEKLLAYSLLVDVTPKDTAAFFKDTQFDKGSWLRFMAVEELVFTDGAEAMDFVERNRGFVEKTPGALPPQVVIGDAVKVV